MFSLIITIISIALVAALALATIYYGGNAFNKGSAEAKASQLINEGQQINGAVTLARADAAAGGTAVDLTDADSDLDELVASTHLAQVPTGWTLDASGTFASVASPSSDVCDKVNGKAGVVARPAAAGDVAGVYACYGAAGAAGTVVFKF